MTRYSFDGSIDERESPDGAWVRFEDVPQWQAMSTAPKDGTEVLVMSATLGYVLVAWESDCGVDHRTHWCVLWDGDFLASDPTHWQPLPLPPAPTPPRGETP